MAGNPAKIIREVSDEMIRWKTEGTELYQALPKEMMEHWKVCEPLSEAEFNRPSQQASYKPWRS